MKKFYVTTPIYYANSDPHVGSAYTTIAADVLARWHRLKGENVFFLTGTDEHGQKIQQTAEKERIKPKEFVDRIAVKFKKAFKLLDISNDNFIRTTDPKHEEEVKEILQQLYDKKFIYEGKYEAYYCVGCEQYLTKNDLVNGKCPLHKKEPDIIKEESYMFKLSGFQSKLLDLIKSEKYKILPVKRRNEVVAFIKKGLQDISISRKKSKVSWGIEIPFDKDHTCFVWVDAFWNYVTGLKIKNKFDKFWAPDVQLMANDILRVHSTIWPALLLALNYELPRTLFIHGYFTINGQKMSKSLGNVISPTYLTNKYGSDALRYFLIREIKFGKDGDFSEEALKKRVNNELANDLGNLLNRTITLILKNEVKLEGRDELSKNLNFKEIDSLIENYQLTEALNEIWKFVNCCNKYINDEEPWKLKGKELSNVLYNLYEALRVIAILIEPFMPKTSEKINEQLGVKKGDFKDLKFKEVEGKVKKGKILFNKIE